ncbi:NAD(P)H-quinone oxidoreductase subunit F [Phormidium sp. LEGE 05292]|uniref:NAD(P)H-quinone oxidoreductase subunit F n=1 Tax=[Phormidium] sp. LEGE 05292 TaxID=767427 RepID=UPI00187FEEB2|nr:NAD(P)H-quinone oxidoreductase subunit F [Phormidium sp. LEGE 05292]MBE9226300.1 NAD(P)H-quinone oxidoreductase subunit F [Phormidium sp. LEGE 05292]
MSEFLLQTIWMVPLYPLAGMILTIPWSPGMIRRTGPRPSGYVNLITTFFAFLHGLFALTAIWNQAPYQIFIPWLQVANLDLTLPLEISTVTVGATVVITGLNVLAQIFAVGYLEMDWGWARLFALMAFFEAGMCSLVLCNSLFFSYAILELLTLGTYLLVGFWFNQSLVVTGARDAFLTKRVGDLFLLMGVLGLYPITQTWNFTDLAEWASTAQIDPKLAALLGLALIAGPLGKCAQFPFHLWLDEAMEGPLPASILRNAVVVATGAWVLVKIQPVLSLSPVSESAMFIVGGATAIGASLISVAQIDIKRALSYLVSAYMGIVFIAVAAEQTQTALLLTFTYSLSMALLVMGIGGVVWNNTTQDLTQYGGLWSRRPVSAFAFIIGGMGLIALPPLGGFWSMQKLVEQLWISNPSIAVLVLIVNGIVAFSLTRTFGLVFAGQVKPMTYRSPEIHWPMALPMMFLSGLNLHVPLLFLQWQLLPSLETVNLTVPLSLAVSSLVGFALSGVIYLNNNWQKPVQLGWKPLQDFFAYDLYTPTLYKVSIVFVVDLISRVMYAIDRYLVDGLVNLTGIVTVFSGQTLKYNVSGKGQFYILSILLGISFLVILVSWPFLSQLLIVSK